EDFPPALEAAAARLAEAFDQPCCSARLWFRGEETGRLEPVGFSSLPCETTACVALRAQAPWGEPGPACGGGPELHPGATRPRIPTLDEGRPLGLLQSGCAVGHAVDPADLSYLESVADVILRAAQAVRYRRSIERNVRAVQKSYEMDSVFIELFLRP